MIIFDGYLCGAAEKHFWSKARSLGIKILAISAVILLPFIIMFSFYCSSILPTIGYIIACVITISLTFIPKSTKSKLDLVPKKIYIEDEYIVCEAKTYTEQKLIDDVRSVTDYPEFYDLSFRMGNVSDKFVCQKDLLVEGTLEEFEKLFEGKIIRKIK